jgi:hypothetical protein
MAKKGKFMKNLKTFFKENTLQLSIALLVIGLLFMTLSIIAIWFQDKVSGGFSSFIDSIGNWKWWILIGAMIITGIGTWLIYSNSKKRVKFNDLINTDSKAKFVRNIDEVEYLAYELGPKYEDMVMDKKESFKIK